VRRSFLLTTHQDLVLDKLAKERLVSKAHLVREAVKKYIEEEA
jgi:predicted DNA-binding protein